MLTIPASEVREGDFIPGLGDAYVFEVEHDVEICTFDANAYRTAGIIGHGFTVINFNDAEGDENYIILRPENPVEVQR